MVGQFFRNFSIYFEIVKVYNLVAVIWFRPQRNKKFFLLLAFR